MLSIKCARCGYENSLDATKCRRCATPLDAPSTETVSAALMNKPQIIGLIGSAILFVGVFTPIVSIPILGSMNYFQNGRGDGVFILALALISVLVILARKYRGLIITGGLSLGMLIFTFITFQLRMSQAQASMKEQMSGNIFAGIGEAMFDAVQLQWGWAVLVIGAVAVFIAGFFKVEPAVLTSDDPASLAARVLGDTRIFVGGITVIAVIAIGLVAMNYLSASPAVQKTASSVSETIFPDKSLAEMEKSLSVEFVGKRFEKANYQSGVYTDSTTVDLTFRNLTPKDISGFKGVLEFKDMFDDPIKSVNLSYDQGVKAGQVKKWTGSLDYNQFIPADSKFRDVAADKVHFKFVPQAIHFADGTKLEKAK